MTLRWYGHFELMKVEGITKNILHWPWLGMTYTCVSLALVYTKEESGWNVMAHGGAQERKWRGNWRMEWVASILHTTSEHGVSNITTTDALTSAASSRLNWRPCRFKRSSPFRRKMKSGFCACAITFQTQSTFKVAVNEKKGFHC